jgi:hypothetical protein
MAMVRLEVDTDFNDSHGSQKAAKPLAAVKVGLLSSIKLAPELLIAFERGLGANADVQENATYKKDKIKDKKDKLKVNRNEVIATVGGRVVLEALATEANTPPFVSLAASKPPGSLGSCRGGILLENYKRHVDRRAYVRGLSGGGVHTDNTIHLLANPNSAMYADEKEHWATEATHKPSYVGDGDNDERQIVCDFHGCSGKPAKTAGATAVIVSDDAFFQANRYELISQANRWLDGDPQRHIVYPSKIYEKAEQDGSTIRPKAGQSTLFGPDLESAYQLLGVLASRLFFNQGLYLGFVRFVDEDPVRL